MRSSNSDPMSKKSRASSSRSRTGNTLEVAAKASAPPATTRNRGKLPVESVPRWRAPG